MRFPTTISSRVGLARDSAMEHTNRRQKKKETENMVRDNPNIERSSFVHQLPKPRVTWPLTFPEMAQHGTSWLAIAMKTAATQNSDSNQWTKFTDGFHRVKCRAHVSRVVKMSPPPPNCIISTPKIDAEWLENTFFLWATVHENRWPDWTPPTTVLVAERKTEFGSSKSDLVRVARGAIWSEKTSFLTPPRTGTRGPEFCPVFGDPQKRTFFAIFAKNTKKK